MKVRKIANMRLSPGHCFDFFLENTSAYQSLKDGEIVEVPDEIATQMQGVEVIKDTGEDDG